MPYSLYHLSQMLIQDGTHGDVDLVVGHGFIPEHFPHAVQNETQKLTPSVHADLAILNRLHQHSIGLHLKKKENANIVHSCNL